MSGTNPVVSVILPVKDGQQHIGDALDRLLNQSYRHLEVVVVDDGSRDGTPREIQRRQERDPRVRIVTREVSGGVAAARNDGIEHAAGQALWFVDVDDEWSQDFVLKMLGRLMADDVDAVFCAADFRFGTGLRRSERIAGTGGRGVLHDEQVVAAVLRGTGALWNKLFRREVFSSVRFPPMRTKSDHAGLVRTLPNLRAVSLVDDSYYTYIRRPGSLSNGATVYPANFLMLLEELQVALAKIDGSDRFGSEITQFRYEVYSRALREAWRFGRHADRGDEVIATVRRQIRVRELLQLETWDRRVLPTCLLAKVPGGASVFRRAGQRRWEAPT